MANNDRLLDIETCHRSRISLHSVVLELTSLPPACFDNLQHYCNNQQLSNLEAGFLLNLLLLWEKVIGGPYFQETLLFEAPYSLYLVTPRAQRIYTWVIKISHGVSCDSVIDDYIFLYCYFTRFTLRFPKNRRTLQNLG